MIDTKLKLDTNAPSRNAAVGATSDELVGGTAQPAREAELEPIAKKVQLRVRETRI